MLSKRSFTLWVSLFCALVTLSFSTGRAASAAIDQPTPSLQEIQRQLSQEGAAFLKDHPELNSIDPENLEASREALKLWHEKTQELLGPWLKSQSQAPAPFDPAAKQGSVSAWPSAPKTGSTPGVDAKRSNASGPQAAMMPNDMVSPAGPPASVNASSALHGVIPAEAYSVRTDFLGPPLVAASVVGVSGTPVAGSGALWLALPPIPFFMFPNQWNPSITYNSPAYPVAYYEAHVEHGLPAMAPGVGTAIFVTPSLGTGAAFPSGGGPALVALPPPGPFWLDYPYIVANHHPGNPVGPGGQGDITVAWVQYAGGAPDANFNGNGFDDPGDGYAIMSASSNSALGPFPYPAFSAPVAIFAGPILPGAHQVVRPSLSVAGPAGTPAGPPSITYAAWINPIPPSILVSFSPAPGLGTPWSPAVMAAPVVLLPPALAPGLKS
jgi:hypothetical protein